MGIAAGGGRADDGGGGGVFLAVPGLVQSCGGLVFSGMVGVRDNTISFRVGCEPVMDRVGPLQGNIPVDYTSSMKTYGGMVITDKL